MTDDIARMRAKRATAGEPPRGGDIDVAFTGVFPPKATRGGYVYFFRCHNPERHIKIGYASDVAHRLSTIRNGCPYQVECIWFFYAVQPREIERQLHRAFAAHRLRGEWFTPSSEIEMFIMAIQREQHEAFMRLLTGDEP